MSKYISAAFFRDVVNRQRFGGEDEGISFDYMLNLIEDEVIKNYNDEQTQTNQNTNDIRRQCYEGCC
jgi:hypothetical protein